MFVFGVSKIFWYSSLVLRTSGVFFILGLTKIRLLGLIFVVVFWQKEFGFGSIITMRL